MQSLLVAAADSALAVAKRFVAEGAYGTLLTVQKALPLKPDGASIILNASIAASKSIEAFGVYRATKRPPYVPLLATGQST